MTVQRKLYASTGGLALAGVLVAALAIFFVRQIGAKLETSNTKTAVKLDLVNAARARYWEAMASLRGVFMFSALKDPSALDASQRQAEAAIGRLREQIEAIRPLLVTEEGRRELANVEAATAELATLASEYVRLCRSGQLEQFASDVAPKVRSVMARADTALEALKNQQRQFLAEATADSRAMVKQSLVASLLMLCLVLGIAATAVVVVRRLNRELAQAVAELSEGAGQVSSAASQVSAASQSLAQGSSEQASALEQTSAAAEEIHSLSRKNSDNSRVAADVVTQSQEKFGQVNHTLADALGAMSEISAQSDKISKIIKTIDEIAFQTNILALNAAVEAARAGEAGMGFAVVADEVRNLAQRCAQAAKDTADLIEESVSKSQDGKLKVDLVATLIRDVIAEAAKVKTLVDEVRLGAEEQAKGIEQISKAIAQMQQVTQQTAASAEEGASASEELHAQAQALDAIAEKLSAMVGQTGASSHRPAPKGVNGTRRNSLRSSHAGLVSLQRAVGHTSQASRQAEGWPAHSDAERVSLALDDNSYRDF